MNNRIAFYANPDPSIENFFQLVDFAVEHNIGCLEAFPHLGMEKCDLDEMRRLRSYADERGVSFCCFSAYADVVGPNRHAEVALLKKYVDMAHILGAPYIHHTVAPKFLPREHTKEEIKAAVSEAVESVREVYDYAEQYGIRAVYENQAFLFNGMDGFALLLDEVDRDVGVVADFGNIYQVNETIHPFIERYRDKIVHVHVKDIYYTPDKTAYRAYPTLEEGVYLLDYAAYGDGIIRVEEAIRQLNRIGYSGVYAMEYWGHTANDPLVNTHINRLAEWISG